MAFVYSFVRRPMADPQRGTGPLRMPQGPGFAGGLWSAMTRTSGANRACQQLAYRWDRLQATSRR
jgi:hypothetical protein